MYAITRLQVQPSGTWCWSVNFSRAGKPRARRFYDPKYGGSMAAKRAAVAWRDAQLAKVKAIGILEFAQLPRANNTSGVPGVTFSKSTRQPEGFWQARLKLDGGPTRTASFSVRLHGERRAYALAVKARRRMLAEAEAEAEDRAFVHHAVARQAAQAVD